MSLVLRVKGVRRETPSTRVVRLDLAGAPFRFDAGQAALLGPAGARERAPYSVASAPEDARASGELEFLVKIDEDGAWGESFPEPRRGMRLDVEGPVGSFAYPRQVREPRLLFIAGGTGVAPIRSMIRHALSTRYPGQIRVFYSARTPRDFAYGTELRGLARRGQIELLMTATRAVDGRWRGARGRMAAEQLAGVLDGAATRCFVCGPSAMVADLSPMLRGLGITGDRIHVEQWN